METKDVLTLAIAAFGAIFGAVGTVTGILSLWRQLDQGRVKLRVRPMASVPTIASTGQPSFVQDERFFPEGASLCVEVVNLSVFPVTIAHVGVTEKRSFVQWIRRDGGGIRLLHPDKLEPQKWPRRLEPRESAFGYAAPDKLNDWVSGKAYAITACAETRYGSSLALHALRRQQERWRRSNGQ